MKKKDSYDMWCLTENAMPDPGQAAVAETQFSLGNGYLGTRGFFEEDFCNDPKQGQYKGTYLNGFYETNDIHYGEAAYGYPETSQTMLNIMNGKIVRLFADNEELTEKSELKAYRRTLDMKKGVLVRKIEWVLVSGKRIRIVVETMVSLARKNILAVRFSIKADSSCQLSILSSIDGDVQNLQTAQDPRVGSALNGRVLEGCGSGIFGDAVFLCEKARRAGLSVCCAMVNKVSGAEAIKTQTGTGALSCFQKYSFVLNADDTLLFNKTIAYADSRDYPQEELFQKTSDFAMLAASDGFDTLLEEQHAFMDDFWKYADIAIEGCPQEQQGMRFNLFHLLQSTGRGGHASIAAKGLTGEGYGGHYFWDSETYVFPFFLFTNPDIAKEMLIYRYSILEQARKRARQMGHTKGALYAWRTINGSECSAYFPAGTAQYHINADISHAVVQYLQITGDKAFMLSYGAEILFETARLWADLGFYNPRHEGKFCINCVTGPDEYNALVDNNLYTNMMARENLFNAGKTAEWLRVEFPDHYASIAQKLELQPEEIRDWHNAAENMYVPYDKNTNLYLQDDGFLDRKTWNLSDIPTENFPLLMHYHPLVIYRHQVCKQADAILAMFLLGQYFTLSDKEKNFNFYEPLTTHDSSLSKTIYSIVAGEIGNIHMAYDFFRQTVRMDLDNVQGNTCDGIHAANMAGAWMCIIYGFAGMRTYADKLSFRPVLPEGWSAYSFSIQYKSRLIHVAVTQKDVSYRLLKGESLLSCSDGQEIFLESGKTITIQLNKRWSDYHNENKSMSL